MGKDKIKLRGNNYKITPEDLAAAKELEKNYKDWFEKKVVDENTPLVYVTGTISNQLNEEGSEGMFLAHAVNLITQQPDEATLILERAGFNVKALPSVF